MSLRFSDWSGKRDSNSRPQPWQGCALPTELLPHIPQQSEAFYLNSRGCQDKTAAECCFNALHAASK